MVKEKKENYLPYITIIAIVGIVAIVGLFLNGGIVGAPVGEIQVDEYQTGCVDDDPRNEFEIAGSVRRGTIDYVDFCDEDKLHQYYCVTSNTVKSTRAYKCPNGCENGICIPS